MRLPHIRLPDARSLYQAPGFPSQYRLRGQGAEPRAIARAKPFARAHRRRAAFPSSNLAGLRRPWQATDNIQPFGFRAFPVSSVNTRRGRDDFFLRPKHGSLMRRAGLVLQISGPCNLAIGIDHEDLGLNRSKIMKRDRFNKLDCGENRFQLFSSPWREPFGPLAKSPISAYA